MPSVIYDHPILALSANATNPIKWFRLKKGVNRINVEYRTGAAGTIVPVTTNDPETPTKHSIVPENGSNISITASHPFTVIGPGLLGFRVSGVSGTIDVTGVR